MGNITSWDDDAIKALNKEVASKLPHANITMSFFKGASVGFSRVFKNALSSFSQEFKERLEAAGDLFENLPPALTGNAVGFTNESERLQFVQVLLYLGITQSTTYMIDTLLTVLF